MQMLVSNFHLLVDVTELFPPGGKFFSIVRLWRIFCRGRLCYKSPWHGARPDLGLSLSRFSVATSGAQSS